MAADSRLARIVVAGLVAALLAPAAASPASAAAAAAAGSKRPNVVLILVDDAGYTDFGAYGGEARTPHIDALAASGALFSSYHSSPLCAPSRAMLLTGLDNHLTGVATIPEVLPAAHRNQPGYSMRLEPGVTTVATRLRALGYRTYMTGKWHLGHGDGDLPDAHGFQRSFVLDASGADNWEQKPYMPYYSHAPWFEDGQPARLPAEFYSSEFLVDQMIDYLSVAEPADSAPPFFAYLAFQAVHIPLQAPRRFTDNYQGVYDAGWEVLREQRWRAAAARGLIPPDAPLAPQAPGLRQWLDLDPAERALLAASMAVNAGMLEAMDHHLGRLVEHLRSTGEYDDTVFIITSDNGPEPSYPLDQRLFRLWMQLQDYRSELATLGERGSYVAIGPEWATVAASPGSLFKFSASQGGLRVPLIVAGPGVTPGSRVGALSFVTDITPTILELVGAPAEGLTADFSGVSLVPLLTGAAASIRDADDAVGIEVSGNAALFRGDYKLVRNLPPLGDGRWRLYNLVRDPAEANDLAQAQPALREELLAEYQSYVNRVGVLPMPEDYNYYQQITRNSFARQFEQHGLTLALVVVLLAALAGVLVQRRRRPDLRAGRR
jgi:arylsulfatase A-like enzyme